MNILELINHVALRLNRHYVFPEEAHRVSLYVPAPAECQTDNQCGLAVYAEYGVY